MESEIGKILRDFKPEYAERLKQIRGAETKYIALRNQIERDEELYYSDANLHKLNVGRLKPEIKEQHYDIKSLISNNTGKLRNSSYKLKSGKKDEVLEKIEKILESLRESKNKIRNRKITIAIIFLISLGLTYLLFVELIPEVFL